MKSLFLISVNIFVITFIYFLADCFVLKMAVNISKKKNVGADDTLWTGGPGNYTNPKAPDVLSKVRSLVDNGKYPEATAAAYDLSGDQTQVCVVLFDR